MRKVVATLSLVLVAIVGCAAPAPKEATKSKVLAAAKHMSASSCRPHDVGSLRMVGCDYLATFLNGEWSVLVTVAYTDGGGSRMHGNAIGVYFFSPSGKFVKFMPGM